MDTHIEIPVTIEYDTQPAQKQTMVDPGFDAELELTSVIHNGIEIMDYLAPSALSELYDAAIEYETAMNDPDNEQ